MIRVVIAVACLLGLAGCLPISDPGETIRIASWNLSRLAEQDGQGCHPRNGADYERLAFYARRLDADVVALQEVQSAAALARVFDPARYVFVLAPLRASPLAGTPCSKRPGSIHISTTRGFAIRRELAFQRHPDVAALGVDLTVTPPSGRPIRLLDVHLTPGCRRGEAPSAACSALFAQLPVVERWIDARATEGVRFSVLGDFNRRLAIPADPFWADLDDGAPGNADLRLAAGLRPSICAPIVRGGRIDHVVLDRRAGADLVSFAERPYGPGVTPPSDHCPIVATLRR